MKTISMDRNYQFRISARAHVQYLAGETYKRVPEVQAREIVKAQAGRVVDE